MNNQEKEYLELDRLYEKVIKMIGEFGYRKEYSEISYRIAELICKIEIGDQNDIQG